MEQMERWLAAALRSMDYAVIVTDARGRVAYMNPVAEALTGWQQAAAIHQDVTQVMSLINGETQELVANPTQQALRDGQTAGVPSDTVLDQQGRRIFVDVTASPIWDAGGQMTGCVLVFMDINEYKHIEAELRRTNVELQMHNADLDAFAHTVAHGLKNPINMIMGYAELLAQDDADLRVDQRQKSLEAIARTARKLNNIVDELLLLASVRSIDAPRMPLDMAEIVAGARQHVMDLVVQYQAELTLPSTWPAAYGYAPWVEEIWANYLSNAIKYGGQPPRVELGGEAQANGTARFWVRDNGAGLTDDQRVQLFRPFVQLAQTQARGYGLGLSIVQRIVEKLGGKVGVDSSGVPGQGCLFHFTLPATTLSPTSDGPAPTVSVDGGN